MATAKTARLAIPVTQDMIDRIDVARGVLSCSEWIRLLVEKELKDHPLLSRVGPGMVVPTFSGMPKLGDNLDSCPHPPGRVHRNVCSACGKLTVKLSKGRKWVRMPSDPEMDAMRSAAIDGVKYGGAPMPIIIPAGAYLQRGDVEG